MKKKILRLLAFVLIFSMTAAFIPATAPARAAVTPKLNVTKKTITGVGKKYTLKLTAVKKNLKTSWVSSKPSVASVTSKGVITAKKKGTTKITCTLRYPGKAAKKLTCNVTVKVPAKAIKIINSKIDSTYGAHIIETGSSYDFNTRLTSSSLKSTTSDKSYWVIEDTSIAKVNSKGVVTALKAGRTTLRNCAGATKTAAVKSSNKVIDEIDILVVNPTVKVESVKLKNSKELEINFNSAMNIDTLIKNNAELSDNISIAAKSNSIDPGTLSVSLSEDKKSLNISSEKIFDGNYEIRVSKNVVSENGIALAEAFFETIELKDITGPKFIGFTTDETGLAVSINFDEPIEFIKLTATNGRREDKSIFNSASIVNNGSNYKLSEDKKSLLLDLSSMNSSDHNKYINVDLSGFTDLAGNTSLPYPMVVTFKTDTTPKTEAKCLSIVRRGNSLAASFDKAIQVPGYIYVNGTTLIGEVNDENKKEVVYPLTNSALISSTQALNVTLSGYRAYGVTGNSQSQYTALVYFGNTIVYPTIVKSQLTTKQVNGANKVVLTLTYNNPVKLVNTTGKLTAKSNYNGIIGAAETYSYTATAEKDKVTLVLTGSFKELAKYTFTIPAGIVKDYYYCENKSSNVTVTKISGDTEVLPGPSSILMDGENNDTIYINFDNMIDVDSAEIISNYSISGLTISSAKVILNSTEGMSIIEIKLSSSSKFEAIPYKFTIKGIKGYNGSYSTMKEESRFVTFTDSKIFKQNSVYASASAKTLTMTFDSNISTSLSRVNFKFLQGSITLKSSYTISGNTITFKFDNELTKNSVIQVLPSADNIIMNFNNNRWLNSPQNIIVQ